MQIFRSLAGYSFGRADIVRRAMAKKKKDVMESERQFFLYGKIDENGNEECPGALKNGISLEAATEIYDDMADFAQYAFNKSHAACYAYLAYYSAYLKCHYPKEYMASLLTSVINNTSKIMEYTNACKKMGIDVRRPDINEGEVYFSAVDGGISFGLMAIKNVGEGFLRQIIKNRGAVKYSDPEDFFVRNSEIEINKRMLESLIKAGAFDGLGKKRSQLLSVYADAVDAFQRKNSRNVEGQFDMFSSVNGDERETGVFSLEYPDIPELSELERLAMEKEMTGLYLSGHPLDKYRQKSSELHCDKISRINSEVEEGRNGSYGDGKTVTLLGIVASKKEKLTKNNARMGFLDFEDETGKIELIVFSGLYEQNIQRLYPGSVLVAVGEISVKEAEAENEETEKREPKILVKSFALPDEIKSKNTAMKSAKPNDEKKSGEVTVNISAFASRLTYDRTVQDENKEKNVNAESYNEKTFSEALYLKTESESSRSFQMAKSLLDIYNYGKTEVYVYFEDTKKLCRALDTHVMLTEVMKKRLKEILGEENVKLKKREK